jgi:integrase
LATLYKRKNSPYWWLTYSEGGTTRRQSTNVRHNNAKKPPSQGVAAEILRKVEDRLACQKFGLPIRAEDIEISKWFEQFSNWYVLNKRPRASTWTVLQKASQAFLKWTAANKIVQLSQVSPGVLTNYFTQRKIADKTRKNEVAWWRMVWDRAKKENHVHFEANPWEEFLPHKIVSTKRRAMTPEESQLLLAHARPAWKKFAVWVGYFTGERYSAILHLKRGDIDLQKRVIVFDRTKQGQTRYVYCPEPLAAFLAKYKPAGEFWISQEKIETEKDGEGKGMAILFKQLRKDHPGKFQGITFHCLRHTYASLLANAGASRTDRMEIMDHSTIAAHSVYVHEEAARALTFKKTIDEAFQSVT